MSYARGDYVLEQEKYAKELIDIADKEKNDILKRAKEAAKREMVSYEEEKSRENLEKITAMNSNYELADELQSKNEIELKKITECYGQNKEKVINFLFENVLTVKYEVPEVVKGFFEEKFGIVDNNDKNNNDS